MRLQNRNVRIKEDVMEDIFFRKMNEIIVSVEGVTIKAVKHRISRCFVVSLFRLLSQFMHSSFLLMYIITQFSENFEGYFRWTFMFFLSLAMTYKKH